MVYCYLSKEGLIRTLTYWLRSRHFNLLGRTVSVLLLVGLLFAPFNYTFAQTAEQQRQINQKTNQLNELQKTIDAKKKEAEEKKRLEAEQAKIRKQYETQAARLENDIKVTENRIGQTHEKISEAGQAIENQLKKIGEKEVEITRKREQINESAAELFIAQNSGSSLMAVVASSSIGNALNQVAALSSLSDKLIEDADELEKQRAELLAIKTQLEQQRQDLESQKRQLAAYEQALDGQKQEKVALADEAKQAQVKFASEAQQALKVSEDLKKQFSTISNEVAAMRRAASKSSRATAVRGGNPSALGFVWPIDGTITTHFGGSTPFQNFHTGLDIAGPSGDPVYATHSGRVSVATTMCCSDYANTVDRSYGYGNWIEIKHDNGYVSRYAHLLGFEVSPGDHVERGQVIGYRGGGRGQRGAGWSTGAHLHFEVWDAQGPLDPMAVLP